MCARVRYSPFYYLLLRIEHAALCPLAALEDNWRLHSALRGKVTYRSEVQHEAVQLAWKSVVIICLQAQVIIMG